MKDKLKNVRQLSLSTGRLIGQYPNNAMDKGITLMVSGGIHGNEPSGVIALTEVFGEMKENDIPCRGNLIGIAGNVKALEKGSRYIDKDLNRIFLNDRSRVGGELFEDVHEETERRELLQLVNAIEKRMVNPQQLFFLDLHTTSSPSRPYVSVNRKKDNFEFASMLSLPVVMGIEEFIPGHFDHYLSEKGYIGCTVEGGQHLDPTSVNLHKEMIYRVMSCLGIINTGESANSSSMKYSPSSTKTNAYEVVYRQEIERINSYKMVPGFENFTRVKKGDLLAYCDGHPLYAPLSGHIFLPLYQSSGSDGFFIVQKVNVD